MTIRPATLLAHIVFVVALCTGAAEVAHLVWQAL